MPAAFELRFLADVASALTGIGQMSGSLKGLSQEAHEVHESFAAAKETIVAALEGLAAYFEVEKLKEYMKEAGEAAKTQRLLDAALRASGQYSAEYKSELREQAEAIGKLAGEEEKHVAKVQQRLVLYGVQQELMEKFTKLTFDLAAAREMDTDTAAELIGRAMMGETVQMRGLRLEIDKTLSKEDQIQQLYTKLNQMAGGSAEAAKTAGKTYKTAVAELEESVGNLVKIPYGAWYKNAAVGVQEAKQKLDAFIQSNQWLTELLKSVGGGLGSLSASVYFTVFVIGALIGSLILMGAAWKAATYAISIFNAVLALFQLQGSAGAITTLRELILTIQLYAESVVYATTVTEYFRAALGLLAYGVVLAIGAFAGFQLGGFIAQIKLGDATVKQWGERVAYGFLAIINEVSTFAQSAVTQMEAALDKLLNVARGKIDTFVGYVQKVLGYLGANQFGQALGGGLVGGTLNGLLGDTQSDAEIDRVKDAKLKGIKEAHDAALADLRAQAGLLEKDIKDGNKPETADAPGNAPRAKSKSSSDQGKSPSARAKEVDEGSEAEKHYQDALKATQGLLESGQLSQEEATDRDIQTTRDYIARLKELQATMDPTTEQYQKLTAQINLAQGALLKLSEGQEAFQAKLDATKAALDAGIISQAQADARDNAAITAQIGRLRQLQATVNQTSAAYTKLETEINKLTAQKQQTTALGQITATFRKVINEWGDLGKNASQWVSTTMNGGISAVSQGLTGLITKTGDWKQTMMSAVDAALEGLIELGIKTGLHYAYMGAMMIAHALLGNTTTQSVVATQTAAGAEIAVAHAPAAAATSVSSYGTAAIVGAVLAIAAIGAIIALLAGGFAEGGLIPGTPSHRDNRIAHVATGEYIVRTAAVQHYGVELLEAINSFGFPLSAPAYAAGGLVGAGVAAAASGGRGRQGNVVNRIKVGGANVTLIQPHTRYAMHEAMKTATGDAIIIDAVARHKRVLGIRE